MGARQHVDIGYALRKRYVDKLNFLPNEFDEDAIYVRSSDVNRTIMSAYS